MKPAVARLWLMVALFVAWMGYLTFLVVCRPHTPDGLRGAFEGRPLTLSRPQILVSMLDIVGEVRNKEGETVVKEVLFPKGNAPVKPGDTIKVEYVDQCKALPDPLAKNSEAALDFTGPRDYILPLQYSEVNGQRHYEVVHTPSSPGFPPMRSGSVGPPRIYPATEEMLAEYREIAKP